MKFRPCIDIHNGKVKQIVGGSLKDQGNQANENFVSEQDASYYAQLYEEKGITGGHVILLNKKDSEYYPETKRQALLALSTYPGGLQVGGGIGAENAPERKHKILGGNIVLCSCTLGGCIAQAVLQGKGVGQPVRGHRPLFAEPRHKLAVRVLAHERAVQILTGDHVRRTGSHLRVQICGDAVHEPCKTGRVCGAAAAGQGKKKRSSQHRCGKTQPSFQKEQPHSVHLRAETAKNALQRQV